MTGFDNTVYTTLKPARVSYFALLLAALAVLLIGGYCTLAIEHGGHVITGMNNHIVWGMPHVFAVSLIVAASGALNGASMSSVFGITGYKPYARLSVVLAMSLLVGGMLVLVLDLGRPDRLIIAMTTYNFRSIFTWNIFLYTGFLVAGIWYLWMMMERRYNRYVTIAGRVAFAWRIVLTTGTGSIFGFLVGRNSLDSALLAPLFIALSLVMGSAVLALLVVVLNRWQINLLTTELVTSFRRLLVWFLLVLLYFSVVQHVTNLYVVEHHGIERHTLAGPLSLIFWLGHVLLGVFIPLGLLWKIPGVQSGIRQFVVSCGCALIGGFALIYVVIIGSQSTPQRLFPDKTVVASSFGDAGFPSYVPSLWEWGLGAGGVSVAVLLCLALLRVLPLTPQLPARSDHT